MNALEAMGVVGTAGAIGGLVAYLSSGGLRRKLVLEEGPSENGFVATMILGAVAAILAWATQAPRESLAITGALTAAQVPTLGDCVAGTGVGLAGAKWLANSYQAGFYRFVGAKAALSQSNEATALAIATGDRRVAASAIGAS